jgi:hypothetical protein
MVYRGSGVVREFTFQISLIVMNLGYTKLTPFCNVEIAQKDLNLNKIPGSGTLFPLLYCFPLCNEVPC